MRRQLTPAQKLEVGGRQQWECAICQTRLGAHIRFDHRVPLGEGGSNHVENFQALHVYCDAVKTRRDLQRMHDDQREQKTGCSRFFEPKSPDYCGGYPPIPPAVSAYLQRVWENRQEKEAMNLMSGSPLVHR